MTVELRTPTHDPRDVYGDRTGGWGSTRTSVVRPAGNPQQVAVTEVNRPEFYNQANDHQPSRVDPRYGLLHTQPAILRPDAMWSHRWPDEGPYRGMTPQPFAWEKGQMNGIAEVTQAQRDRYRALSERARTVDAVLREFRRAATTDAQVGQLALIGGQLERVQTDLILADDLTDEELSMALEEMDFELDQLEERLQAYEAAQGGASSASAGGLGTGALIAGGAVLLGALWWISRER